MGSGKTSMGKILAHNSVLHLWYGCAYRREYHKSFRDFCRNRKLVSVDWTWLSAWSCRIWKTVISTGGGVPVFDNMEYTEWTRTDNFIFSLHRSNWLFGWHHRASGNDRCLAIGKERNCAYSLNRDLAFGRLSTKSTKGLLVERMKKLSPERNYLILMRISSMVSCLRNGFL